MIIKRSFVFVNQCVNFGIKLLEFCGATYTSDQVQAAHPCAGHRCGPGFGAIELALPHLDHVRQFPIEPSDTGIFWLNVGDKYHWLDEDIATLEALANRDATLEEVLKSLPKFSQTAISNMSLRKCGERIVPKANHRLDAYTTREDMNVLDEYGIGIEPIAEMRGAVKAREFNGQEYWSLAYTKRKECHDIVFFVENRDDGTNQEASR